jgi:hypothetical protein
MANSCHGSAAPQALAMVLCKMTLGSRPMDRAGFLVLAFPLLRASRNGTR